MVHQHVFDRSGLHHDYQASIGQLDAERVAEAPLSRQVLLRAWPKDNLAHELMKRLSMRETSASAEDKLSHMSSNVPPERFHSAYEGTPPWDIGRPQRAFQELLDTGNVRGPILDVGCGTGENTLAFAAAGHEVVGVDIIPKAIETARRKASERGVQATFQIADALALENLGSTFRTVIDSAVFHVFSDEDRIRYVSSLARVLEIHCTYYMLCFSDAEPAEWGGPRRIRREEIVQAFGAGWTIHSIVPTRLETTFHEHGGHAWFATIERSG